MEIRDIIRTGGGFVIGMVHCLALPGTMNYGGNCRDIIDHAVTDAKILEESGVDAIIVENMGDSPFAAKLDVIQANALAVISQKVKEAVSIPVGIDAAFNDYEVSLSIAHIIGATFVRIPVFVDTVQFYGGFIDPCARACMNYRKSLGDDTMILADVQVKHTNLVLPHVSIETSAKNSQDCGADAIIVTGSAIGLETPIEMISRVKKVVKIPVIAGSGVNAGNIKEQFSIADGAIVGSSLKEGGKLENPISGKLTKELLDALRK
ncbi:MAG: BtpA/SgcQ family protein [Parasporobacterium sp.]|nr:BtpA/SgcQ family protein [Parasporobacterium sp.]